MTREVQNHIYRTLAESLLVQHQMYLTQRIIFVKVANMILITSALQEHTMHWSKEAAVVHALTVTEVNFVRLQDSMQSQEHVAKDTIVLAGLFTKTMMTIL